MKRREVIGLGAAALLAFGPGRALAAAAGPAFDPAGLRRAWQQLEARSHARLGVCLLDTGSGQRAGWRQDERFPMCSTVKLPLVAAVLAKADRGVLDLAQPVPIREVDLLSYAPFSKTHVGSSATIDQLCEAAMTLSDNTAANLLLPLVGGAAGLTAWLRGSGDALTRSDRNEPSLNSCIPGDPRDTTTPAAMVATLQRVALGGALTPASRQRLQAWLRGNRTGDARLRGGVPNAWTVGDKTGTGSGTPDGRNRTSNDIGMLWRPGAAPLVVSCYLTGSSQSDAARDAVIAEVGRTIAGAFAA